jgi:hypothetical protein
MKFILVTIALVCITYCSFGQRSNNYINITGRMFNYGIDTVCIYVPLGETVKFYYKSTRGIICFDSVPKSTYVWYNNSWNIIKPKK